MPKTTEQILMKITLRIIRAYRLLLKVNLSGILQSGQFERVKLLDN